MTVKDDVERTRKQIEGDKNNPELQECLFEERKCRFAEWKNGEFNCMAPSDKEMTCQYEM